MFLRLGQLDKWSHARYFINLILNASVLAEHLLQLTNFRSYK